MSKTTVVLVTGATGNIGTEVCASLAQDPSLEVRAALRNPGKRAWLPGNVAAVPFDFEDPATIDAALQGVDKLFLLAPGGPMGPGYTQAVIAALGNHSVKYIVKQSSYEPAHAIQVPTDQWALDTERMVRETGIPWTFLQPPWCNQNFSRGYFAGMVAMGVLALPFGDGASGWIDTRDIGEVTRRIFTEGGHEGQSYCLTGPRLITLAEIARVLSEASGRQIVYQPLTDERWLEACEQMGMPPLAAQATLALIAKTRDGHATKITDDVERITGRKARSFEQFAQDSADEIRKLRDSPFPGGPPP
jgi:uncharacterized protein YbjT (DUF2867 family)